MLRPKSLDSQPTKKTRSGGGVVSSSASEVCDAWTGRSPPSHRRNCLMYSFRWNVRIASGVCRLTSITSHLGSVRNARNARPLRSSGITPAPHYYGPLRLPGALHRQSPAGGCPQRQTPGPPTLHSIPSPHAVPLTPAENHRCVHRLLPDSPRAFPEIQAGRPPQLHFRGLLRIHSHSACGFAETPHVPFVPGTPTEELLPSDVRGAIEVNQSYLEQDLHLLAYSTFPWHTELCRLKREHINYSQNHPPGVN